MKKYSIFLFALMVGIAINPIQKATAQYSIPAKQAWWYDARFGMFIHFGSYSYLAHGEWAFATENWTKSNYQTQVTANFNPTNFNATTIVGLAKTAGMKYLVITAKHHEGFCMWNTNVASFKDVTGTKDFDLPGYTNFKTRDILQELKTACDAQGIKFCLYYSILDWDHPSQTIYQQNFSTMSSMTARTNYINDMKAQLSELITKYHPAIMWFDGDWTYNTGAPTLSSWWTKADGTDLYNYLIGLDPNLVVNERVFRGAGLGDFECPEQNVPSAPLSRQWETNQTMNNSWGYNSGDNNWKSTQTLIRQLVQVVSRDGNYLLNIGPMGDGTVPSASVSILNGFGTWMSIYSESIYGATRSPYSTEPSWGYFTKKAGKLYAHVFNWPTNGQLSVPSLTNTISSIYLLNAPGTSLNYTVSNGNINISVPTSAPNANNSVVVIAVSGVPTAGSSGGCSPTAITPYLQVNGGTWTQTASITVSSGATIILGPQPVSGGSWSWSGLGTSGTSREQTIVPIASGTATATYTNTCGSQSSQAFAITVNGTPPPSDIVSGGTYQIIARHSGKVIGINGASTIDGALAVQQTYAGVTSQQFVVTDLGTGYYRISPTSSSAKALDVNGNSTADGANIIQWTYGGGNNQQWQLVSMTGGYYQIKSRSSGKCIDVNGASTADGASIIQWTCGTSYNQQWTFTRLKNAQITTPVNNSPSTIIVYPNPSRNGRFFVNLITLSSNENVDINIYSLNSSLLYTQKVRGGGLIEVNSALAAGIYILKIANGQTCFTEKIVIE